MDERGPWLYKAEGNQHIVLSSPKDLQIIRLKKAFASPLTTEYCLAYSEALISSLLSTQYYSPCTLEPISSKTLEQITRDLDKERPDHRKTLEIDITQQRVMLQRDLTLSYSQPVSIAFELKPKYAILYPEYKICKYCAHQLYKHSVKGTRDHFAKDYCPLDLFSGDLERVGGALEALLRTPKHPHARVFVNGFVASLDSVEALGLLETFFGAPATDIKSLLTTIISQILIQDPILSLLKHRQGYGDIKEAHRLFKVSQDQMTDFPANSLQFLKETIELLLSDPKQQQTKRPHVFSSLLSFLISKSLMDCSLMIRFEKESHLDNRPVKGTSWFYSLIVVDVEPKAVTKIPSYFAHDVEIQEFTASHPEFKACVT